MKDKKYCHGTVGKASSALFAEIKQHYLLVLRHVSTLLTSI